MATVLKVTTVGEFMRSFLLISMFAFCATAEAQSLDQNLPTIKILQTSDLHSHFTNRQSQRALGGYARLKSKINQVRDANTLLLDSGDWSEGSIFFTLGSGVQSQRLLEKLGYDALVLGNHDWLVGPNQMYESFVNSGMKTPVLSANLNFKNLSPEVPLSNFIKPYVIKEVNGVKVGIFGLSTFQLIYDSYFSPVTIKDPIRPALDIVNHLRKVEHCQVVIALTHLGLAQDEILAKTVKGIDLILGGHDHRLLKEAKVVNGVPIVHVGQWGEFLGEYELALQTTGKTKLTRHKLHQIDMFAEEDPEITGMVEDSKRLVQEKFNEPVFSDQIAYSEVDLTISGKALSNDVMGQWSVDAMRKAAGTDIAVDTPLFSSSQLRRGFIHTADIFDLFPHIYVDQDKKAWTIYKYEVHGYTLRALLSLMVKFKMPINMSNVKLVVDMKAKDPIKEVLVGGENLNLFKDYMVASNPGVLELFKKLKSLKIPIGPSKWTDTGLEVWRVSKQDLVSRTPITPEKIFFEPRVRTTAPDLMVSPEFLRFEDTSKAVRMVFKVFNAGLKQAPMPEVTVKVDKTPLDALDDQWMSYRAVARSNHSSLAPGESVEMTLDWPVTHATAYTISYPIEITVDSFEGEQNQANNSFTSKVQVLTIID